MAKVIVGKFKFANAFYEADGTLHEAQSVCEVEIPVSRFDMEKMYSVELEQDDAEDIAEYVSSCLSEKFGKQVDVVLSEVACKPDCCVLLNLNDFTAYIKEKKAAEQAYLDLPLTKRCELAKLAAGDDDVEPEVSAEDEAKVRAEIEKGGFANAKVKFARTFVAKDGKTYEAGKTYMLPIRAKYWDSVCKSDVTYDPDCMDEVSRYMTGCLESMMLDGKSGKQLCYIYAYLDDVYGTEFEPEEDVEVEDPAAYDLSQEWGGIAAAPKKVLEHHDSKFGDGEVDHSQNELLFKHCLEWGGTDDDNDDCIPFFILNMAHVNEVLLDVCDDGAEGDEAADKEVLESDEQQIAAWTSMVGKWLEAVKTKAVGNGNVPMVKTADGEKSADELIKNGLLDSRAKGLIDTLKGSGTQIIGVGAGEHVVADLSGNVTRDGVLVGAAQKAKSAEFALAKVKFIKDVPDAVIKAGEVAYVPVWQKDFDPEVIAESADVFNAGIMKAVYGEDVDMKAEHDFKGVFAETGDDVMHAFETVEDFDEMYDTSYATSKGSRYDFENKTVDHSQNSCALNSSKSAVVFNMSEVCKKLCS